LANRRARSAVANLRCAAVVAAGVQAAQRGAGAQHSRRSRPPQRDFAARLRAGKGPVLIEAKTYRHMGHHVNDPGKYMPEDELAYYNARDPVDRARAALQEMAGVSDEEIAAIEAEIAAEFADAVEFSKNSPEVTPESFREFAVGY
jgi:pyruvate dehydrogenase E1 component alpha subunit